VNAYQVTHRLSPEEAAREVRYRFLSRVAREVRADRVAVGHTRDDHIETVLMHLIRGSGTRGLRGLLPHNQLSIAGSQVTIVRPLLEVSRQETANYCRHLASSPERMLPTFRSLRCVTGYASSSYRCWSSIIPV